MIDKVLNTPLMVLFDSFSDQWNKVFFCKRNNVKKKEGRGLIGSLSNWVDRLVERWGYII